MSLLIGYISLSTAVSGCPFALAVLEELLVDPKRLDFEAGRVYPFPLEYLELPYEPMVFPFSALSQRGFNVGTQPQIITREISSLLPPGISISG